MTSSELKSIAKEINALHAEFKQLVSELQADGPLTPKEKNLILSTKNQIKLAKEWWRNHYQTFQKQQKAIAQLELPPQLIDERMKNEDGSYKAGYKAFAATEEGRVFLERFSSKYNNSTLKGMEDCDGGDMSRHYLSIIAGTAKEMRRNNGVTYVNLVAYNNSKNIELTQVTEKDVQHSQLKFYFVIYTHEAEGKEAMAQTLGHEVFVHAQRYADAIAQLLHKVNREKMNAKDIAQAIQRIGKQDVGGYNDHQALKKGKKVAYEQYLRELQEVPKIDKNKIKKEDEDDKSKY